jgi:hypothetical protein
VFLLDLSSLVEEALRVQSENYVEIIEKAIKLFEKESGQVGNQNIVKHLVELEPS